MCGVAAYASFEAGDVLARRNRRETRKRKRNDKGGK
jgi:hypothetical protein